MTFTNNVEALATNLDTHRPLDIRLKHTAFKEEHYCAYFKYLVTAEELKDVPVDHVHTTAESKKLARKYLDDNDPIPSWISEHYNTLPDTDPVRFITTKDLYKHFKESDHYTTLSKVEKRQLNESSFRHEIAKSSKYKPLYREAMKVKIGSGPYNTKDGVVNIAPKDEGDAPPADVGAAGPSRTHTIGSLFKKRPRTEQDDSA